MGGRQIIGLVYGIVAIGEVEVYLVWDPAWDMEKMSEDAKLALDIS